MNSHWVLSRWFFVLLVTAGGLVGCGAFFFFSPALIAMVSKTSAIVLGAVWLMVMGFALKVADITEAPSLTPIEHDHLEDKVRVAVRRIWLTAGVNFVAAIGMLLPSVLVESKVDLSAFDSLLAGTAISVLIYTIVLHAYWQEELRRFRSDLRAREREEKRADDMRKRYGGSAGLPLPDEVKSEIAAHNKAIDWPTNSGPH